VAETQTLFTKTTTFAGKATYLFVRLMVRISFCKTSQVCIRELLQLVLKNVTKI